jgi:hypothetical protein
MSWETFKTDVVKAMQTPNYFKNSDEFAEFFAKKYERAVKSGTDIINKVPLKEGNYSIMENQFKLAFYKGLVTRDRFNVIKELGKGVVSYWRGATLQNFPVPLIPAPGSTKNVSVTNNKVTSPGTWPNLYVPKTVNETETWVNIFIFHAQIHLSTLQGRVNTKSIYPPNGQIQNGSLKWFGFKVPPPVSLQTSQISLQEAIDNPDKKNVRIFINPVGSGITGASSIKVKGLKEYSESSNFFVSDGKEGREFRWISYPNTAEPV